MATIIYTAKSFGTYLLPWPFLGRFGAHRFYLGQVGWGFLYMVLAILILPTMGVTALILIPLYVWDIVRGKARSVAAQAEITAEAANAGVATAGEGLMHRPGARWIQMSASALFLTVRAANALECGDVSGGGDGVRASDALAVLRHAVGQDVELECVTGECLALEPRVAEVERRVPILRDAAGVELGTLVSADSDSYVVILPVLGKLVELRYKDTPLAPASLVEINNNVNPTNVRFVQPDCAGEAIIQTDLDPAHLYSIVREPPNDDHYYELLAPLATTTATASRFVGAFVEDGCENIVLQAEVGQGWWTSEEVQLPFPLPASGPVRIDFPK